MVKEIRDWMFQTAKEHKDESSLLKATTNHYQIQGPIPQWMILLARTVIKELINRAR